MGIKKFYGSFIKKNFKDVIQNSIPQNIEGVSIDMNGSIHEIAQQNYYYGKYEDKMKQEELKKLTPETLEAQFYIKLSEYLNTLIKTINPKEYFIICVDGVANPAKANQQRHRRYLSSIHKNELFNNACITPGTEFMIRLDTFFQSWIATNRERLPKIVIYSSHLVPGEGEQKIFNILRSNNLQGLDNGTINEGNGIHAVIGLDADLIMLSSLCKFQKFILIRESYTDIIDITNLRKEVVDNLTLGWDKKFNEKLIIQDFVIMVFLLGNDFLPHFMAFHDINETMTLMSNIYTLQKTYLSNSEGAINWKAFSNFLSVLSQNEARLIREKGEIKYDYPSKILDTVYKNTKNLSEADTDNLFDHFRTVWYNNILKPKNNKAQIFLKNQNITSVSIDEIDNISREFIFGIQWNLQYYIGGDITNKFIYSYLYSPLLCDVLAYLTENIKNETIVKFEDVLKKNNEVKINPIHQLLSVIHPTSAELIPVKYRHLIMDKGNLSYMTPMNFNVEFQGDNAPNIGRGKKAKITEYPSGVDLIVILPSLELDTIIEEVFKIDKGRLDKSLKEGKIWITQIEKREQPREKKTYDKPYEKKPYEKKTYDKPYEKKPYEKKTYDKTYEKKTYDKHYEKKPYEKKQFDKPYEKKAYEKKKKSFTFNNLSDEENSELEELI